LQRLTFPHGDIPAHAPSLGGSGDGSARSCGTRVWGMRTHMIGYVQCSLPQYNVLTCRYHLGPGCVRVTLDHHRSCGSDHCTHPPPPSVREGKGKERGWGGWG